MRLCRFESPTGVRAGFYDETRIVPLDAAARACPEADGEAFDSVEAGDLLDFLPNGALAAETRRLFDWVRKQNDSVLDTISLPVSTARLLVPNPRPNKLFLLAGNYADHIAEGGGIAAERAETFPYVFMKPPTTTLTDPGRAIRIPQVSPSYVDWELELGVVIGLGGKHIAERDALAHVAGYTIINDISDRKFRPNPGRKKREKDSFFDWLHGKWHDSFCPCGPCMISAEDVPDPQALRMKLSHNGTVFQDATTAQQIFPVAAVIEFISSFVTLEPGDMISTGTPAGVGNTTRTYLQPGDRMEAFISGIGTLVTPVEAE